ncbi:cell division control protein 48 homolog C-like isoform X2 [Salvia splendens]|uniref:cell division control protein 48 homolog C-like isoform X2 n=1 Tax=Salvia splendens TaxID=180675 RepID=UPI001C258320|nr:cell division control protein 48 homolog C-like isoform X2 [Salvia splendens]
MASGHREKLSMAGLSDRIARSLLECHDQTLRCLIEPAAAGAKNLSDAQIVQLICSTFPLTFSRSNCNLLIERVAKISPLSCRRESAGDEPAAKKPKFNESQNANRQIEVAKASASASYSDSNGWELDSARSYRYGGDGWDTDANGDNMAIIGGFVQGNKLGNNMRELKKNEDKWPMFSDIGGRYSMLEVLKRDVIAPMHQLKVLRFIGGKPSTSILLHGPPGCGKTMLARAIGNEARVPFYETSAVALKSGVSGILELFSRAYKNAPSIVFIDEIDALTSETESLWQCPAKQLMACMKESVNAGSDSERSNSGRGGYVLTIGATNKPNALDLALRQRFDREFYLDVPKNHQRHDILSVLTSKYKVDDDFDLKELARLTQGFVAGDLVELVNKARMISFNCAIHLRAHIKGFKDGFEAYGIAFSNEELEKVRLTRDSIDAIETVWPSAEMEEFSTTPCTNWDDVGGLQLLKLELERRIVKLIKFPQVYESLWESGVKNFPTSFFLYGPSGCGKTLIVDALAKEAGANLMHIKGNELSKFEWRQLMVNNIFKCAKTHPPCIVFFDEVDVLSRDDFTDEDLEEDEYLWKSWEYRSIWAQVSDLKKESRVYVIVTSSRPEILELIPLIKDDFGRTLYAPLPTPEERGEILKILARNKPIDVEVDLMALGKDAACENFSGSDLFALMTEAIKFAIDRPALSCGGSMTITNADFEAALAKVSPSLSTEERNKWVLHAKKIDVVHGASAMDW